MKFTLNESRSDIVSLAKACVAAANNAPNLPTPLRDTLSRAAHTLDECKSVMEHAVQELEAAAAMRAGLNDTMSKHDEIARNKNRAMEHVAGIFRSRLEQYTPRDEPKPRKATNTPAASDEVI